MLTPPDDDTARAIHALLGAQTAAWNAGDAEGFAITAADDLRFTNIRGQRSVGRQPFVEAHRRIFGGIYAGSQLEAQVESIALIGPDVVHVELLLVLRGAQRMPPGIAADADGILRTRLLELFVPDGTTWRLVSYHNVSVLS